MGNEYFYKVLCEEVDVFGKQVYTDINRGSIDEVCNFIQQHWKEHNTGTWVIMPMAVIPSGNKNILRTV